MRAEILGKYGVVLYRNGYETKSRALSSLKLFGLHDITAKMLGGGSADPHSTKELSSRREHSSAPKRACS